MFLKTFKLKTSAPLRSSEAKKFRQRLENEFPNAKIDLLMPPKSYVNVLKVTTYYNFQTNVYCVDKLPIFFEMEGGALVPTLYALWQVNDLLPYFTTFSAVVPKLLNGADLMLPGIIPQGQHQNMYGRYKKDQLVALNLTTNLSAIGVGYLARSSDDLYMCGGKGVGIKILHLIGDKLWGLEPTLAQQPPLVPPQKLTNEDFPELGSNPKPKSNKPENVSEQNVAKSLADIISEENKSINASVTSDLNNLTLDDNNESANIENSKDISQEEPILQITLEDKLKHAFLKALKNNENKLQLPILTSNFYRNYIVPETEEQIEIKKTKYKKLSNFLAEMSSEGFIETKEETKGVDKITVIHMDHPEIINFITDYKKPSSEEESKTLFHSELQAKYIVSDSTAPFFAKMSYQRGQGISEKDLKQVVRDYIKKFNLQQEMGSGSVYMLDDTLKQICGNPVATFGEIVKCLISEMSQSYLIGAPINKSGDNNKPLIQMFLESRAGNKKVTIIANVENYGIVMSEFMKQCKEHAAASVSLVKLPSQKKEQVLIQGNQIHIVYKLLTEKYKIPPRCIKGKELARKEKKK